MKILLVMEHTIQKIVKFINFTVKHVIKASLQILILILHDLRTDEKTVFLALK
jgi:hypothetical protein